MGKKDKDPPSEVPKDIREHLDEIDRKLWEIEQKQKDDPEDD